MLVFTLLSRDAIKKNIDLCDRVYDDQSALASKLNTLLGIDSAAEESLEKEGCRFLAHAKGLQLVIKKDTSELRGANKSISLGKVKFLPETYFTDLSGWNQSRFLALHIYFLVKLYMKKRKKQATL